VGSDPAEDRFSTRYESDRAAVDGRLAELVGALACDHEGMREAISWSLLDGGKRLRPVLCLWTHDLVGGDMRDVALDAACAIECVHTYSLIHDDLPCMDDDDFRRGKPSSHRKFGEATAVLAGDALLTLAFQILSSVPERHGGSNVEKALEMAKVLSTAAGTGGLIAGQALDLAGSGRTGDLEAVRQIHVNKTGRLIAASMEIGAVAGSARQKARERLSRAGTMAGEAFQIVDDVLDGAKDRQTLGKTPGKDALLDKLTYPSVVGVERAREEAGALVTEAKTLLSGGTEFTDRDAFSLVAAMFDYLVGRGS
jgi:geranylgeranyl pyrophosphate synthase